MSEVVKETELTIILSDGQLQPFLKMNNCQTQWELERETWRISSINEFISGLLAAVAVAQSVERPFFKGAQARGRTWDLFVIFRLFSLSSSALDHSATGPHPVSYFQLSLVAPFEFQSSDPGSDYYNYDSTHVRFFPLSPPLCVPALRKEAAFVYLVL